MLKINTYSKLTYCKIRTIFIILFVFISLFSFSQVKIATWNIENFGSSKSDSTIVFIANTLKDFDVVAIQEVVTNPSGAQKVAQLVEELNRKGSKWDYTVSPTTSGSAYKAERYAFLWRTAVVKKIGDAWLDQHYVEEIQREPYLCRFTYHEKPFTLVTIHAITKKQQPETEIKYLKFFPNLYPNDKLIFLGDFNLSEKHTVFNPLKKMGYSSVFQNQKTSLKQNCKKNNCLASELDNIFYHSKFFALKAKGIILFHESFFSLKQANFVSDHLPIWSTFILK